MLIESNPPKFYEQILEVTRKIDFSMSSGSGIGALLSVLVSSKAAPRILELGTGTGLSLAWISQGADRKAKIISIDNNPEFCKIAFDFFKDDKRIEIYCTDAKEWLINYQGEPFDFVFADTWAGKFNSLDRTLQIIRKHGFYIIDDLLPQANWPTGHAEKVELIIKELEEREDLVMVQMDWSTGIGIGTKR